MIEKFFHYSFLDGRLIGSEHPGNLGNARAVGEHFVRDRGVRTFVLLAQHDVALRIPELEQHHRPIRSPPTAREVEEVLVIVRRGLVGGDSVWVACDQGLDRTGCVMGCLLTRMGIPPDQAIEELLARFPPRRRTPVYRELWEPYATLVRCFGRQPKGE
ncbi:MAG: hypothetical protein AB1486_07740 [Planctomycetota bacterium]